MELVGACPQIALLAKVSVAFRIKEAPNPNVKLPLVDKKRSLDILLNDETIMFVPMAEDFSDTFYLYFDLNL